MQPRPNHRWTRNRRETFANLDSTQSAHAATNDFLAVHRDPFGRRPLSLGPYRLRNRRLQRWPRRASCPQASSANFARSISRPHSRQTPAERNVPCTFHSAQNPLEILSRGFQPRYFHPRRQHRAFCNRRTEKLQSQYFRKSEHLLPDRRRLFCLALSSAAPALGMDRANRIPARHLHFHDYFGNPLRVAGTTALARSSSGKCNRCDGAKVNQLFIHSFAKFDPLSRVPLES